VAIETSHELYLINLTQLMTTRQTILMTVRLLIRALSHFQVIDPQNIPSSGAYILAMNHMSRIDPALVAVAVDRSDMTALVGDSYKKIPPFRWLINSMGGIWINRQGADLDALRQAIDFLRQGGLLGIAPEGTRSKTGMLVEAKTGVAYLATKAQVPIIPAAVSGSESAISQLVHLRRPRIRLQFGKPLSLPPLDRKNREAALQQHTDEVMCRIAAMLPPQYWGAYRDHPRLQALVNNSGESTG
jgi:1-acyl-sn-glycerol-3-phosphate acyltransferase